ncbi:MAG: accessory Sec system protein translocase subunit SecY2 [Lachnospiraceae bacterium]|jgi:preprotein translocase subunit SecY|nr:accessory Sec system protein translocase subunit SecY2 [Lachnospiraceae bacterium]MCI1422769.1 accessory Sec system protein translocase subunit SecY2 [Lachnospiraceae bacterium]MCI1451542.1 accessory Sec system protein translocase subunit SecY2 [Lachnospiraceae bacterium]
MRTIVGKKAGYTGMILLLYILGREIPLPWVTYTPTVETGFQSFLLQMVGTQTRSGSLLSLGLMPWMTASIVSALFRAVMPADTARSSPARARRVTALLGLVVALIQAYVTAARLNYRDGYFSSSLLRSAATILVLTGGAFAVAWLAEQNRLHGIGGQTALILVNVESSLAGRVMLAFGGSTETSETLSTAGTALVILFTVLSILLTMLFENSEIRIPIRHVMLHNDLAGDDYLAVKLNPSGMMPVMYVMSLFVLPYYLCRLLSLLYPDNPALRFVVDNLNLNTGFGIAIYSVLLVAMTFALAFLFINPSEIAKTMQENNDIIPGYRPGQDTKREIRRNVLFAAFCSAAMLFLVVAVPMICRQAMHTSSDLFTLSTSLCILVGLWNTVLDEVRMLRTLDRYRPFL